MRRRVYGVIGWKNSGKTTLMEKLIAELTARGWTVAAVKHAHHDFDIDKPGADSFRHRAAGAREVAIVSARRWALMHEGVGEDEPALGTILGRLSPCDLVLVEGYKRGAHRKIETRRAASADRAALTATDPNIAATASDYVIAGERVPVFDLDDAAGIADFIEIDSGLRAVR